MTIALIIGLALVVFVAFEYAWLKFNGSTVPRPTIERTSQSLGSGKALRYVIMGDSVAAGQGGDYDHSPAVGTAHHLGETYKVDFLNTGVSGARTKDIVQDQLAPALAHKPDVVLIIVGSNDVTHLTSSRAIASNMQQAIDQFVAQNCDVKIVLTGSAAMGTARRIPQPLRYLAGIRSRQVNTVFDRLIADNKLTLAPVARDTGPIFENNKNLFAADNFHPNNEGYAVWTEVLSKALDDAIQNQPSHCKK